MARLGIADPLVFGRDVGVETVLDWKSDVAPSQAAIAKYQSQIGAYLAATGCPRGLIVFMTSGQIVDVAA